MHFRKCLWLLAILLFCSFVSYAQDSSQSQTEPTQPPTQQQRAEVLREAQARVNARRRLRIQQIIQDTYSHKYELTFGGAYLRFHPGQYLQRLNEPGWQVDVADYLAGNLGVAADFRGYYGTAYTGTHINDGIAQDYNPSISQYSFMGGPRYRFFRGQHWGWTAEVLAGINHGNFGTGTNGLPPQYVGLYTDTNVLSVAPGVSADYNLGPGLAIRFSANDIFTNYNSSFQENRGGNLGIVYRFGRK